MIVKPEPEGAVRYIAPGRSAKRRGYQGNFAGPDRAGSGRQMVRRFRG